MSDKDEPKDVPSLNPPQNKLLEVQSTKPDKGDSKDFVEHLRTVHFTLVTVCLALIVILQFPSPVSMREAIHQLSTIADAAHVWKGTWVEEGVPKELNNSPGFSYCVNPVTSDFGIVASGMHLSVHFPNINWTLRTSNPMRINGGYNVEAKCTIVKHTAIGAPQRLDEFKTIWNNSYSILCPIHIADESVAQLFAPISNNQTTVPIKREALSSGVTPIAAILMDNGTTAKFKGLYKSQNVESEGLFYSIGFLPVTSPNDVMPTMANFPRQWEIPVLDSKVFHFDFRSLLIRELPQYRWLHGEFKDAFFELDQATAGFQDLDFDHIKQILQNNERNSKEAFQAFGVTFPIETTTKWGTLIIIMIQFYFWLHFLEYRKRQLDETNTAWIGSYTSIAARLLFCSTALVAPIGVVAFVSIKATLIPERPTGNIVLSSIVIAFSLLFSFLTAKEYCKKDVLTPVNP